jgi:hypothetical protein
VTSAEWDQQVGYALESPLGTFTAPTRAIEHVKSGLKSTRRDVPSKGKRAGRRGPVRMLRGVEVVAGVITHELSPASIALPIVQAMGAVATTGSGPYSHACTDGVFVESRALSVQAGVPDAGGTVRPENYIGCQIKGGKITVKAGSEPIMIDLDFVGRHMQSTGDGDTVAALTTAVYNSAWAPMTGLNAVLSINGSEYEFDELTFDFDNALRTGFYVARSTTPGQAKISKESGQRRKSVTLKSDFHDLTVLNRAVAGTEVAFSLAMTQGTGSVTIAGNVRTQVDAPTAGDGVTKEGLTLDFVHATADASACTITVVNGDSAP